MRSLLLELTVVFVVIPLLVFLGILPNLPIPFLLLLGLGGWLILRRDPTYESMQFANLNGALRNIRPVFLRGALLCGLLGIGVWSLAPRLLFSLMKTSPALWSAVMVLYPLLSVYPQEFIFRLYFFHRYQPLFGANRNMILASALMFGFAHIAYGNWISVILSTAGGFLFATTYRQSGSLLLACVEHALFGNFVFTIGLGQFFYHTSLPKAI